MSQPAHLMRWAGSKRRFADRLLAVMPERIESYCAPFGGSLADVFALAAAGRFESGARIVVSDVPIVRDLHRSVANFPDELVGELVEYGSMTSVESAYRVAVYDHNVIGSGSTMPRRAAALLALNQLAFNGLYRVNRKGMFNTPRDPAKSIDVDALVARVRACHDVLRGLRVTVEDGCWQALLADCQVVYADPPYISTFNAYSADPFNDDDQRELADVLITKSRRGAVVIASNSDTPRVRELYPETDWRHMTLTRPNNITADGATRSRGVPELLMVAR